MSETNNKLEIKNLSKQFGEKILFENLSLTVDDPAVLWAPSGWGKTTLLRILMGLEAPTSGSVEGVGRVGAVFQEDRLCPQLTAEENVALVLNAEQYKVKIQYKEQIRDDLIQLGLDDEALALPARKLSGGQKRRVAVAGVMAMKPRILVLDEPAAGLDPEGRDEILSEVKDYHKKTGTTVLLVSHSMEDIAKYADKVLVMSRKKIAMYDTVEKVFARAPELLELGLSVPQVTKIFLKLREMGVDVPADVYTIPYAVKMILAAKARRDAGETLVLPRNDDQKGGAAEC